MEFKKNFMETVRMGMTSLRFSVRVRAWVLIQVGQTLNLSIVCLECAKMTQVGHFYYHYKTAKIIKS